MTARLHFTAYKLLVVYQRPPPLRAKDIELSHSYLSFASLFGASLNAALVTFLSRSFQEKYLASNWEVQHWLAARFGIFAAWNVGLLLMMHVFGLLVPKVSETISTARLRAQYLERYNFEKELIEDGNDDYKK
jgi:hypothetical protein